MAHKFSSNSYDTIIMDIQMPGMDGLATTRKIRSIESAEGKKTTPIIGMTAHVLAGDKEKCFVAGMNGYVAKPFKLADLKEAIQLVVPKLKAAS